MFTVRALPEFEAWLVGLTDGLVRDTVLKRIRRVQLGSLGATRSVGGTVSEMKIDLGAGWRIYYTQRANQVVFLLTGGSKRTQDRDIARAKALAAAIKSEVHHGKTANQSSPPKH